VRIYLFRPILAKFCTSTRWKSGSNLYNEYEDIDEDRGSISKVSLGDMLAHRMALQCSILCVNTARELIDVVYNHLTTDASWGQKPSWLFSVLRTYPT
jgi:hypothetical protein